LLQRTVQRVYKILKRGFADIGVAEKEEDALPNPNASEPATKQRE
jgi:hypothetical protein